MTPDPRERLLDLLADDATQPLPPDERTELNRLLGQFPGVSADELADAAAAVQLSISAQLDPLPPELSAAVGRQADAHFTRAEPAPRQARWRLVGVTGWATAAAMFVAILWLTWPKADPPEPTPAERRDQLLATNPKKFESSPGMAPVRGSVVWNHERQEGYLEVEGLPANDPGKFQYQLWIVDGGRTHSEPLDGGVFDVPTSRVVVAVRPQRVVRSATVFAVTEELPGGVVVSEAGKNGQFVVVMTPTEP